jgi:hypothetical protein
MNNLKIFILTFLILYVKNNDFGEVDFKTGCDENTKIPFNQAVAILHSFWFSESYRRFEKISQDYPTCTIAYWGMAMSL